MQSPPLNRRDLLKLLSATALVPAFPSLSQSTRLSPADDAFLDDTERRACLFFTEQVGAKTGQVLDRAAAGNTNGKRDPRLMASIAATGYGLTGLCIADQRRYLPHATLLEQARRTLRFHLGNMPHEHGFLYHFNDVDLGGSFQGSEVSPIDTSLLLCGALTARAHFHADSEIVDLATKLYERVDWPWMLNGASTFALGWRQGKFIPYRWDHYCELMMMVLLALGSPTHPADAATWDAFTRPRMTYAGFDFISSNDPIFIHQFSHAWFDFRLKRDKYADYFANSILATRAHKAFCLALGKPYTDDYWGINASDSQHGYTAWGGPSFADARTPPPPKGFGGIDGSIVPAATAGSLPFLPVDCLQTLRATKTDYPKSWGRYGFCDALHPAANWYDPDVLGIDLGIGLLMSENLRTGFVWQTFARNPEVAVAFQKAGFKAT